jgi:hypothetical protein
MSNGPHVVYRPREDASAEGELNALVAAYRFVLFDSQARRGDQYDLTNSSTTEMAKNGPRKTEQEKT